MKTEVANESQTVAKIFAITQDQLNRDLALPWEIANRINEDYRSRSALPGDPSCLEAGRLHQMLLLAYAMQESGAMAMKHIVFLAGTAASDISTQVLMVALEKGRLRELSEMLLQIKNREGRSEKLAWTHGDGPADYEATSDKFIELVCKVSDSIQSVIFQRYRLTAVLDLYQKDYPRYYELFLKGQKHFSGRLGQKAVNSPLSKRSPKELLLIEQAIRIVRLAFAETPERQVLDYCI